jgi:hypothetical protein
MKSNLIITFVLLLILSCPPVASAGFLSLEVLTGPAVNFPVPTRIKQSGFENMDFNARFDTRPFELPLYYMIRASRWKKDRGWEVEFTHDKLYLTNNPPEVESFSITHGYNIFCVNYAWRSRVLIYRVGGGMIVSHPESTIRCEKFPESGGLFNKGYYLSGPVMATSVGGRLRLHDSVFISIESKLILSYAHVPIRDGSADLFVSGLRLMAGVGMDLLK